LEKPRLIAANKMDCEDSSKNLTAFRRKHKGLEICKISCTEGTGLDALKKRIRELVEAPVPADADIES
jgi:50S ribosomal subunit-associated GTPase HflX